MATRNGGTTAPVGTGNRRRSPQADVAADPSPTGVGSKKVVGRSTPPPGASSAQQAAFYKRQNYEATGGRLKKALGKGFQKKIYGKDYKYGTLKNLNKKISETHNRQKSIAEKGRALKAELASGSGNKSALQDRLHKLEANSAIVMKNRLTAKADRQKFTNMRNAAVSKLSNMTPAQKEAMRKRGASKVLEKHKEQ